MTSKDRVRTAHRPEYAVLSGAVGLATTADAVERLRVALAQVTGCGDLLRMAWRHGVLPSLYRRVAEVCPDAVSPEFLAELQKLYQAHSRQNLRMVADLLRVLHLFASHDIHAIPYKGPVLAAVAYGDIALRQFVDLDILVRRQDIPQVNELLLAEGYRFDYAYTQKQEQKHLRHSREFTFVHPRRTMLDVHWMFVTDYLGGGLDLDEVFERKVPIQLEGRTVYSLAPEDMLLMLCLDGTLDLWDRLAAVSDVAHMIHSQESWDWPGLLQRAGEEHMRRQFLLGVSLAQELLGAPVPQEVVSEADANPAVVTLRRQVMARMFVGGKEDPGFFEQTLLYLKTRDCLKDKVNHIWIRLAIPTVEDWRWVPLPDWLYWLYYIIRPLRLGWQGLVLPLRNRLTRLWTNGFFISPEKEITERL